MYIFLLLSLSSFKRLGLHLAPSPRPPCCWNSRQPILLPGLFFPECVAGTFLLSDLEGSFASLGLVLAEA